MATKKKADGEADAGQGDLPADEARGDVDPDEVIAAEQAQGFAGDEVDPTPNEAYTVAGQAAGMATPETDEDAQKAAKDAAKQRR